MNSCLLCVFRRGILVQSHLLFLIVALGGLPSTYQLEKDWLLDPSKFEAKVVIDEPSRSIVLENGLVRRIIHRGRWSGTAAIDDLMTGRRLLRAIRPEAVVEIDGHRYEIGGIQSQPNHAYLLPVWIDGFEPADSPFALASVEIVPVQERFPWKRNRHASPEAVWPPAGKGLQLNYRSNVERLSGITIRVCYEIFDGIPVMTKWIEVHNDRDDDINVDHFVAETLAVVPYEDPVEYRDVALTPPQSLHVETDYAFQGMSHKNSAKHSVHWLPDPQFHTQVNYLKKNPCLLEVRPLRGPDQTVAAGHKFRSFRVFELIQDSEDRERRGLAQRQFYRRLAPWVTENPLILHVVSSDAEVVQTAIDQAAECGFEMVSLSFGSGLNMEDESSENHRKFKRLSDYALSRGIHLGGYSLLSSRRIGKGVDVVSPPGDSPTHGSCPALSSSWGLEYFRKLSSFFEQTGFLQFTHDGSYPGDWDVTPRLPIQKGLADSQWVQWSLITEFYQKLRAEGVYLRIPDYYYLSGANECGMGYREVNWSLPRAEQVIHTRQNIFDGTWEKTPSMGWMFVPLTQYHGGGAAATIEPLSEHLEHYEKMMVSNLLLGVQAVYRGTRLYDTPSTRSMVQRVIGLYKKHRTILESDLLHLKRADGQGLDYMLHVNPTSSESAFLVVFNPLSEALESSLRIPLYYSGLEGTVLVTDDKGNQQTRRLDRNSRVRLPVKLQPDSYGYFVFRDGSSSDL